MASFSLYVHVPFCVRKCPYCDFNSYAVAESLNRNGVTEKRYVEALCTELSHFAQLPTWQERTCETIFFGGGTPSLFDPASFERILSEVSKHFRLNDSAEITIEANPGTIAEELGRPRLEGYRNAGINRISIGAQSFSEAKLHALGRIHSPLQTHHAVRNLREAGFTNFNLDLMFAVCGESVEQWRTDLETALSFDASHLSIYGLTIEPGTEFAKMQSRGAVLTAEEDLAAEMYILTQEKLAAAGYSQYELSNYSRPGLECQHNLGYWSNRDYLGLGAGAHSFLSSHKPEDSSWGSRWSNLPGPQHYIERVEGQGNALQRQESLSELQARTEFFFLGLRRAQGVDAAEYSRRFGGQLLQEFTVSIRDLTDKGLLEISDSLLRLTRKGFLFADSVFCSFAEELAVSPQKF